MAQNDIGTWIRKKVTPEVLIAFVLGLLLGLVVLGWWLWPVKWTDTDPADLRPSHKETYLQMVAESYALNGNNELARARLEALKKLEQKDADLSAMLMTLAQARIAAGKAEDGIRLQRLVTALGLPPPSVPQPAPATSTGTRGNQWPRILGILFFLALLGAGVLLLLTQLQRREPARRRRPPPAVESLVRTPEPEPGQAVVTPPAPEGAFVQFETAYKLGEEGYDVSYSIEAATGDFLGECGVSALEKADLGEPDRFTAFDVWLFDKLDSRTETKVLMSERAFGDQALRAKLADRGELIQAEEGRIVALETENLRLYATVAELEYEGGSNNGVFAKLATKLEVSPKERVA